MKFFPLATGLLLASGALAVPADLKSKMKAKRADRLAQRIRSRTRRTVPPLVPNYTDLEDGITVSGTKGVTYDSNWAGAIIVSTGIQSATGTFTVPTISVPAHGSASGEYGASAWVGIDGDTCRTAILQTGVDFVTQGGETAYSGWYEWYPYVSKTFSGFEVQPGDQIQASVVATGAHSGTATLDNLSSGQQVTHNFTAEKRGHLCGSNAEWIVEDFLTGSSFIGFGDFDQVNFTQASYSTSAGAHGLSGATIMDIKQGSKILTSCSAGEDSVSCQYL